MSAHSPPLRIELTLKSLLLTAAVVAGCWTLIRLIPIVLVVVVALIFAGTVEPAVAWLERHRLRRGWAVALVFGGSLLIFAGLCLLVVPPLVQQVGGFLADWPRIQGELAGWLGESGTFGSAAEAIKKLDPKKAFDGDFGKLASMGGGAVEFLGYLASSVVIALYVVADHERARGAVYAVVPRRHHVRLARILTRLGDIVGHYMRGQLITSAAIFGFTFALLTILKVEGAIALAAFAALTDVIPFVGGLLATTPVVLASMSKGTMTAIVVLALMLAYQEFESRILVPMVYGKRLRLAPSVVIVALLVGGKLYGILGALLALPIAAALRMVGEELRVELPGDASSQRRRKEVEDERAQAEYERQVGDAPPEQAAEVASEIADHPPNG